MQPTQITYLTVTLLLALAVLINWKHRQDAVAARLNRGLRGYLTAKSTVRRPEPEDEETNAEDLIPA